MYFLAVKRELSCSGRLDGKILSLEKPHMKGEMTVFYRSVFFSTFNFINDYLCPYSSLTLRSL